MKVRVLMFGALADAAVREDGFDIVEPVAASDVIDAVRQRYPKAADILSRCSVAVDQEMVDASSVVPRDSEVALLPPMSGGAVAHVLLTDAPCSQRAAREVAAPDAGGAVTFTGTVRDACDAGPVERLEYSAYEPMAMKVMADIAAEATLRWGLSGVAIEHGVGVRAAGEVTFVVVCAAGHREQAFDACRYVVDEVKRRAPIWKREIGPWGQRWVGL